MLKNRRINLEICAFVHQFSALYQNFVAVHMSRMVNSTSEYKMMLLKRHKHPIKTTSKIDADWSPIKTTDLSGQILSAR